jgi:hypothetical protein
MTNNNNNGRPPDDAITAAQLAAKPPTRLERAKVEIERLARLLDDDIVAYELDLRDAAKALSLPVRTLEAAVKKRARTVGQNRLEHSNTYADRPTERMASKCSNNCTNTVRTDAEIAGWRTLGAPILEASDPLEPVRNALAAMRYAGDTRLPELLYVAVASRFQIRPINVHIEAQSASGKNFAITSAVALHPEDAVYWLSASSPRALIYSDASFTNRVVVLAEMDSIPADGPAASAIRSIAEDACLTYETVEKDVETGKFITRKIVKAGPTGFITSGVRPLDRQMSTRCLTATVPDDTEQTRAVLRAEAAAAAGGQRKQGDVNVEVFHAAHRWLDEAGVKRVIVPFAAALADLVPANAVRVRRDFKQLLTCIQTLAFLSQLKRDRTRDGALIATLDDYTRARRLLEPLFDAITADGVTPAVRETVLAIGDGEEISETELAERLGVAKSTVNFRIRKALRGGWLKNTEMRRGYPAKLSRAVPLPEVRSALPEVEDVRKAFEPVRFERSSNTYSNTSKPLAEKEKVDQCSSVRVKSEVRSAAASTCLHGGDPNACEDCWHDRLAAADAEGRETSKETPPDDDEVPF